MEAKTASESSVTLTHLMGPAQANTLGHVHGGWITSEIVGPFEPGEGTVCR